MTYLKSMTLLAIGLLAGVSAYSMPDSKTMSASERSFRDQHLRPLLPRKGANNKIWDELIRLAVAYQDKEIMNTIFRSASIQGQHGAEFRLDLFKIYRQDPVFFVHAGNLFYQGKLQCLAYWLVPESNSIPFHMVKNVATTKLQEAPQERLLDKFLKMSKSFYQGSKWVGRKDLESCTQK